MSKKTDFWKESPVSEDRAKAVTLGFYKQEPFFSQVTFQAAFFSISGRRGKKPWSVLIGTCFCGRPQH